MPELITGTKGTPHVTSTQDRSIYEKIIGKGSYILDDNELLEPELQSNQSLRIRSGMLYHHGSITEVKRNTYDEVTIANGSQGMKRIDLVVARYTKNPETEIEEMNWVVIQGTPAASDPATPAYTEGNMQEGDLTDDCPVFEVHLDGIQVTEVVKLLKVLEGSLESLNSKIESSPESTLLGSLNLSSAVNTSVALSQSIDNFREILVIVSTGAAGLQGSWFRPVSKIDLNQEFNVFIQSQASYWQAANFKFPDKTHIQLTGKAVAGYALGSMSVWGFK